MAAIAALRRAASERETADAARYREMVDYYTAWVHQIKTPIAAMRLTLQPDDTPNARRLMSQLLRIEQYVDMVLMYLRLDEGTSDYVIRACDLDGIIRQSLRKFAMLEKDAVIIGVHNRAEIWSAERWKTEEEEEMTPEKMAACMAELGF